MKAGDPRNFPLVRRKTPESLRYLADQLREGTPPVSVALALEVLADGLSREAAALPTQPESTTP